MIQFMHHSLTCDAVAHVIIGLLSNYFERVARRCSSVCNFMLTPVLEI